MDDKSTFRAHGHMADYRKILGTNLREARKAAGLSQEALALEIGIDRTYISGIERGVRNPSLDVIVKLAERVGVEPGRLLVG
ncbi:MAG: helix-turn-helix transcriptional regulator [Hyphomicrobiales bacterium]